MNGELSAYMEEFLGLEVSVVSHSNPTIVGRSGTVVGETKRMIEVLGETRISIPKHTGKFKFRIGEEDHILNGDFFLIRPEERPKSQRRIMKLIRTRSR
jgi:RNase P/RNase MRP subunit p29